MHLYFCTEYNKEEIPLSITLWVTSWKCPCFGLSLGRFRRLGRRAGRKNHQSKELRGWFLGKVSCKFAWRARSEGKGHWSSQGGAILCPWACPVPRDGPGHPLISTKGTGWPCLPKYQQQINGKKRELSGRIQRNPHLAVMPQRSIKCLQLWDALGMQRTSCARWEKGVGWKVACPFYLLTGCVVPFHIQQGKKETGSQETSSQDGHVSSSMGFFF